MAAEVTDFDSVVIGGGFFGSSLAIHLAKKGQRVLLCEKENGLLRLASFANQARVHGGYHYPRALLTARRSQNNYQRFCDEFADCIREDFDAYYAIARAHSKVTASQFERFCEKVGAPLSPAPEEVTRLFHPARIEKVFKVREGVWDAVRMAKILETRLKEAGVDWRVGTTVQHVAQGPEETITVKLASGPIKARRVYVCLYAGMNEFLQASRIPSIPLKVELTEMALVRLPPVLASLGVTVMCGPFFSVMPFPSKPGLHTLSHVRYTPHTQWQEGPKALPFMPSPQRPVTHFVHMMKDAARYLPLLAEAQREDSLWALKAVLPSSELDDSRPILYVRNHGLPGLTCILGGKIDNVYDMLEEVNND